MKNNFLNIIAIAPLINNPSKEITGPATLFEFFKNSEDVRKRAKLDIFDISGGKNNRKIGGFSISRLFFYINLLPKLFINIYKKKDSKIYIIIAPTKAGLLRDFVIIYFSNLLKRRLYCHALGNYPFFYENSNLLIRILIKKTLRYVEKIIIEDEILKEGFLFLEDYQKKVISVTNSYPPIQNQDLIKKKFDGKKINIFFMGNMIESKGYFNVIKVINLLKRNKKFNVTGIFAGKFYDLASSIKKTRNNPKNKFFKYIYENNLEDNVRYYDSVYGEKKEAIFKDNNFFIFPTNYIYEAQPLCLIEAMSYGSVIITCKHSAIKSMITHQKNGFFVQYNKPDEIISIIEDLANKPEMYESISKSAIENYKEKYMSNGFSNKLLDIMSS